MLQNVFSWIRLTLFRPWFLTIVYPYWLGWLPRLSTVDHFHRRGSSQAKRRKRRADSFPENVDFRRILLTLHLFWFTLYWSGWLLPGAAIPWKTIRGCPAAGGRQPREHDEKVIQSLAECYIIIKRQVSSFLREAGGSPHDRGLLW